MQPDEGISVRFEAKLPGTRMQLAPVMMSFRYGTAFGGSVPEAYETLLLDAMIGDPTLFARHDFVEASWALITPVHERWRQAAPAQIPIYEAGEWGPAEADALMTARRPPLEDAVSDAPRGPLLENGIGGAVLRRSRRRSAATASQEGRRASGLALTATVVAVGPPERLARGGRCADAADRHRDPRDSHLVRRPAPRRSSVSGSTPSPSKG